MLSFPVNMLFSEVRKSFSSSFILFFLDSCWGIFCLVPDILLLPYSKVSSSAGYIFLGLCPFCKNISHSTLFTLPQLLLPQTTRYLTVTLLLVTPEFRAEPGSSPRWTWASGRSFPAPLTTWVTTLTTTYHCSRSDSSALGPAPGLYIDMSHAIL